MEGVTTMKNATRSFAQLPRPAHRSAAFTLIELLVVISIIGLLMAILLPSLSAARDSAKTVLCMTRERSLGGAIINYTADYKFYYPRPNEGTGGGSKTAMWDPANPGGGSGLALSRRGSGNWFNAVDAYMNLTPLPYASGDTTNRNYSLLKQDPIWSEPAIVNSLGTQTFNRTIKMNTYFDTDVTGLFANVSDVQHYSGNPVVLLVDGRCNDIRQTGVTPNAATQNTFDASESEVGMRHGKNRGQSSTAFGGTGEVATGGVNVYFDDGSAKTSFQPYTVGTSPNWYPDTHSGTNQVLNWRLK